MKPYETLFISPPDIEEETLENLINEIKSFISECGGVVENVEKWGKRELAYEIDNHREGYYTLMNYRTPGDAIEKIRHKLKFQEGVLRYLIVKQKEQPKTPESQNRSTDQTDA